MKKLIISLFLAVPAIAVAAIPVPAKKQQVAVQSTIKDLRPEPEKRLFRSEAIEKQILDLKQKLTAIDPKLYWMFVNCFPNTLDTTVHYTENDSEGHPDTFVYTGDIHAMWLRDSGAQVFPYVKLAPKDKHLHQI